MLVLEVWDSLRGEKTIKSEATKKQKVNKHDIDISELLAMLENT